MDYRLEVTDLSKPDGLLRLKTAISEIADECDVMYSETAPNGNVSARQGRLCLYNDSGTYSLWQNTTGLTTWVQLTNQSLWEVDGDETQLKTADEIDMQSKKIINVTDPVSAQDASTKNYTDGKFNTSTGHDHDGSDSKKVLYTNLDMTGITNAHYLYNNNGTPAGAALVDTKRSVLSTNGNIDASSTKFMTFGGTQVGASAAKVMFPMPFSGTLKNLYAATDDANADVITITVEKDDSDTSLTCTIATTAQTANDTSNTVSFSAGELLSIRIANSRASAVDIGISCEFYTTS